MSRDLECRGNCALFTVAPGRVGLWHPTEARAQSGGPTAAAGPVGTAGECGMVGTAHRPAAHRPPPS